MTVDVEDVVKAIRDGDKLEVVQCLRQGIDPNDRNKLGWTLLHIACLEGRSEIAEILLDKGASVNSCTTDMCTPLHRAASQGNRDATEVLLNKGAYINAKDKNGNTPLHEAAKYLHTNVVKLLLEKKADKTRCNNKNQIFTDVIGQQLMPVVESGDVDTLLQWLDWNLSPSTFGNLNWSILHHASARGQINIASLLLERGANVNAKDSNKSTSLHAACFHGNKRIVELLIGKCANVNAKDQMGNTPLHSAISGAHPDIINMLLESGCDTKIPNSDGQIFTHLRLLQQVNEFLIDAVENKRIAHVSSLLKGQANPDTKDSAGSPVLCVATFKGDLLIADALLESGANPNLPSEDNIKTPLHYASILGHFFILKSLLDKGASVSAKDRQNKTPLHEAAKEGFDDMVTVLVGRCSPMDAQDNEGNTPLHLAARWGHTSIVDMLIEKGANDAMKNNDDHNYLDLALMRAVRTEDTSQVMACLAWGGDPNTKDNKGWYLLHHAAYKGALEVCHLLIESEAKVNVVDKEDRTPLLLAAYRGNQEIMEELIKSGADINMKDKQHQTPLHWAAAEGSVATVELLLQHEANRSIRNKEGKLYTELLLKHLYFAVRHNDLEKVQCLLRAGADQTAIVKGTGTSPRDEAKRRKNFGILRQMLSLAPKKKIQEDSMAIEFISNLFEEYDSSTEDETSSSNRSDSEDSEYDEYWKMHNAPVIVKERDIMDEESKSFWKYWEEKPTVISVKDWCKEDVETFWDYWEDKPEVISAKDYFKDDLPWWQRNSENESDTDESEICTRDKYFVISFQDAKKKWGEVITAKEFFKDDECWWRDAVKELYSSDEEETEDGYKVLNIDDMKQKWGTVISAKEFFREDECWWRDAVEEVSSSDEDSPIHEISVPTMEEIKRKWGDVISAKDVFDDNDAEWLNTSEDINSSSNSQNVSSDNDYKTAEIEINLSDDDTNTSAEYKDWETSESWSEINDSFASNSTMYSISEGKIIITEGSSISDGQISEEILSYDSDTDSTEGSITTEKNTINDEIVSYISGVNSLEKSTIKDSCTDRDFPDSQDTVSMESIAELNSDEDIDEIEEDDEIKSEKSLLTTLNSDPLPIEEINNSVSHNKSYSEFEISLESLTESKDTDLPMESVELPGQIKKIDSKDDDILESNFTFYIKPLQHSFPAKKKISYEVSEIFENEAKRDNTAQNILHSPPILVHSTSVDTSITDQTATDLSASINKCINANELLATNNAIDTLQMETPAQVEDCLNSLLNTAERICISNFHTLSTQSNGMKNNTAIFVKDEHLDAKAVPEFDNIQTKLEEYPHFQEPEERSNELNKMVDDYQLEKPSNVPVIVNKISDSTLSEFKTTKQPKNVVFEMDDCLALVDANLAVLKTKLCKCHTPPPNSYLSDVNQKAETDSSRNSDSVQELENYAVHANGSQPMVCIKTNLNITNLLPSTIIAKQSKKENVNSFFDRKPFSDMAEKKTISIQGRDVLDTNLCGSMHTERKKALRISIDGELILAKQISQQVPNTSRINTVKYSNDEENLQGSIEDQRGSKDEDSCHFHYTKNDELLDNLNETNTKSKILTTRNIRLTDASSNTVCIISNSNINNRINEVSFCDTGTSLSSTVAGKPEDDENVTKSPQEEEVISDRSHNVATVLILLITEVTIGLLALIYNVTKAVMTIIGIPSFKK